MATTQYPATGLAPRPNSTFVDKKPQFEMEERKEPTFIQFADGELAAGVLLKVERITVKEKPATRYTIRDLDGEFFAFLGTYQIDTKLSPRDVGHYVEVRCEGEDSSVSRNGNAMKIFNVRVSKQKAAAVLSTRDGSDPGITDDDIPF